MAGKTCAICGKPSGMYPICRECFKLKDEGKVEKCEECGKWHYSDKPCDCTINKEKNIISKELNNLQYEQPEPKENFNNCIVCGKESNGKIQCTNCYNESKAFCEEQNRDKPALEHKDYYFNLKSNIYRIYQFEQVKKNCNKLIGLTMILSKYYDNNSLTNRVINDIEDIIIAKTPKVEEQISEFTKTQDKKKEEIIRTQDGHWVRSNAEEKIDDILYNLEIIHAYGKQVTEVPLSERTISSDWFIPVLKNKGIYIEYWGMDGYKPYEKNKAEKLEIYHKYNIDLIQIEKDDIKGDSQGFANRLEREINELKTRIKMR